MAVFQKRSRARRGSKKKDRAAKRAYIETSQGPTKEKKSIRTEKRKRRGITREKTVEIATQIGLLVNPVERWIRGKTENRSIDTIRSSGKVPVRRL